MPSFNFPPHFPPILLPKSKRINRTPPLHYWKRLHSISLNLLSWNICPTASFISRVSWLQILDNVLSKKIWTTVFIPTHWMCFIIYKYKKYVYMQICNYIDRYYIKTILCITYHLYIQIDIGLSDISNRR